jgi:HEAT repeat protein
VINAEGFLMRKKDYRANLGVLIKLAILGVLTLPLLTDVKFTNVKAFAQTPSRLSACDAVNIQSQIKRFNDGDTKAFDAVVNCGEKAVTRLIRVIKYSKNEQIRVIAIASLGKIGVKAVPAIPVLSKSLTDESEDVRIIAVDSLEKIGLASIPSLIKALQTNDNWIVRYSSADALSRMVNQNQKLASREIIPTFVNALEDEDCYVQTKAADVLGKIGKNAVPYLIDGLQHKNAYVREKSADALRMIGADAKAAIPALKNLLQDENKEVRSVAGYAIDAITKSSNNSINSTQNPQNIANENTLIRYEAIRDRVECRESIVMNAGCIVINQSQIFSTHGSGSQNQSTIAVGGAASTHFRNPPTMCRIPVLKSIFRWKCRI